MNYKKKGQAAGAVGSIITLVMGVAVATLLLIFTGTLGGSTYSLVEEDLNGIGNHSITNEVVYLTNNTPTKLLHTNVHDGTLYLFNTTEGTLLDDGNYTFVEDTGLITYTPNGDLGNESVTYYANYSWGEYENQAIIKGGITSGFEASEQVGDYLPIVVLAIIVFLVLGLIVGFGGSMGGSNATAL